ncbi:MAG TPA: NfeD family protein, partial [Actinomycetota bacterium]|nr:NfeD family protein [Actinomycetota bacterium]
AAHVAAMAPGTAIGAATPVDLQGGDISDKIINDAAAYAESIAQAKGRNVTFAGEAVRKGRSVTAEEAARIDVVDLLADDVPDLLNAIDGQTLTLASGRDVTLRTAGATMVPYELRGFRALLQRIADPNIAFLFLSIGTLAILYELGTAGVGGAGIVGVIMIVLAFFSLSVLPVNAVGALLMFLAAILLIAEVFTPGVGVFAAGGVAALVLGGIFLFRGSVGVDAGIIVPVALSVGAASVFIGRFAWRTRNRPSISGEAGLIGERGVVRSASDGRGRALIAGAWWNIRSDSPLTAGRTVRVKAVEGLDLIVEEEEEDKP